ncbi:MAG: hypothetical protein EP343_00145, partial [Deltaproteobacteria bacterium]
MRCSTFSTSRWVCLWAVVFGVSLLGLGCVIDPQQLFPPNNQTSQVEAPPTSQTDSGQSDPVDEDNTPEPSCYNECVGKGIDKDACLKICELSSNECYTLCLKEGGANDTCQKACANDGTTGDICYKNCISAGGTAIACKTKCYTTSFT